MDRIGGFNGASFSAGKQMAVVNYVSDGTGRDSYVIKNHGGTCEEYTIGHVKYPEQYLREQKYHPF